MTRLLYWCLLTLALLSNRGHAQAFFNLSFEYATPNGYPRAWQINEGSGLPSSIRVDSAHAFQGRKSLLITARKAPLLLAGLLFPVEKLRGHTLTITAQIRTDSLQGGAAQFFHYDYGRRAFESSAQTITQTTPWQSYSYSVTVPPDAQGEGIVTGVKVNGTGKVFMDAVSVSLDGKPLSDTSPFLRSLTIGERGWLNRSAIPIQSLQPTGSLADLQPLRQFVGSARLVALGENSHGSGSIFRLKHRLIRYLVEEMNFTVLAMEAPAPEADRVNAYVQRGEGSLAQVVQYLGFKSWQTQEVLEMIQWMRAYNKSHVKPIEFRGFDLQSQQLPLENLIRFAQQYDSDLLGRVQAVNEMMSRKPLTDSLRRNAYEHIQALVKYLTDQNYSSVSKPVGEQLRHDAQILAQSIGLPLLHNRREWMAQNIAWLVDHHPVGTKFIIWAANGHVSKQGVSMGHYLKQRYGNEYLSIGFTFKEGNYAVYGPQPYYPVQLPYPGTYEYLLGQAKHTNYFLSLKAVSKNQQARWLAQTLDFRDLGTEPQPNQFRATDLMNQFDAVIYLSASEQATYLKF